MNKISNQINKNHIKTDDLAFSAFLRLQGYHLVTSNNNSTKKIFVFDIGSENSGQIKMDFINSKFLTYYNELRNLKKLL